MQERRRGGTGGKKKGKKGKEVSHSVGLVDSLVCLVSRLPIVVFAVVAVVFPLISILLRGTCMSFRSLMKQSKTESEVYGSPT